MRSIACLAAALVAVGCSPWPIGARLDPKTSGLIGEWETPDLKHAGDTIVWRFHPNATFESLRIRVREGPAGRLVSQQRLSVGGWQVHDSTAADPRRIVCLGGNGPRQRPSCRFYSIDMVTDASRPTLRRLVWEGWIGEKHMSTEALIERRH